MAHGDDSSHGSRMPRGVKRGLLVALALILGGAVYLFAVRGEALLLDLSAGVRALLCL